MTFLWPESLALFVLVPALVVLYVVLQKRKKKLALRYASLSVVKEAMSARTTFRRHVPPLLFLLSVILLIIAIARPMAVLSLPTQEQTVILAMDVSGSMRAQDVKPSRIVAAQEAAKAFIGEQPPRTRIGIVSFAATASVVQRPTQNREDLLGAIDRFQLQRGTAIGSGLIVSLATLFPEAGYDVSSLIYRESGERDNRPIGRKPDQPETRPVAPGSYTSAAIILLTDGQRTTGPDPLEAAKMAADKGIRVFTVGVGTKDGEDLGFEGWSMRVRLDEESLKSIATMTRGEYFYAGTAVDLKKIYESLNSRLVLKTEQTEVTAFFAAAAGLLSFLSALLSFVWFNRIL